MTILSIKSLLFNYFSKNDTFNINRDFKKIIPISENEKEDKAIVNKTLENFVEDKILVKCEYDFVKESSHNKEIVFILIRPLETYNQNVELRFVTAKGISDLINEYCEIAGDKENVCDITNITERDIQNLIALCHRFSIKFNKDNKDADND